MRVRPSRPLVTRVGVAIGAAALAASGLAATSSAAAPGAAAPDPSPGTLRPAAARPTLVDRLTADKAPSSALAQTPAGLRRLTSAKPVPVMIKYDYDAAASYQGGVRGYAATSPAVTDRALRTSDADTARYLGLVRRQEAGITAAVRAAAPAARVTRSYRIVYGGVAAVVPGNAIRDILSVPGVVAVQRDAVHQPLTDSSTAFINAGPVYQALGGAPKAGQGVLLGNLDSGVWPEHPSFAARADLPAYSGPALPCEFGDNPLTAAVDPFVCNNKLVGGRAFLDTYASQNDDLVYPDSARDSNGHGSHTASTSAGNVVRNVQTIGPVIAKIQGVAPGSQVAEYAVCGPQGCFGSDTSAAVEQAILDGVDVINYSISGGSNPATDPTELAFLDAYNAGVFVAASAGNSGPGAATADHASPWVTTVAASTQRREFASTLTLTADDGATFTSDGASITAGAGPLPIAMASDAPYSDRFCLNPAPAGTFTGQIVVCARGGGGAGRVSKGFNVLQGGAAGMILYNPTLADTETDNHWLPAVHLADGTDLLAFVAAHTGITASFTAGAARNGTGDVMAAFSSRGPLGNFVKPDITAPGVQILAATTPTPESIVEGPPGNYYQAIAGTSMSSPHIAGAALLVRAAHPTWTPGQIKSALMTQARTGVVKEDLTTPADPFDMGAGRVDIGAASAAPLTISDTAANMTALFDDPLHAIDLNIPSINAPTMPGRITTTRTVTNVTKQALRVTASARTPAGTRITFSPAAATVPAGGSASFRITLQSSAPVGSQQFAQVRFATPKGTAHLPVAFVRQQGSVSLTQTCAAPSVRVNATTTCTVGATNNSFDSQDVTVTTTGSRNLRLVGGATTRTQTLAGAQLGVPSLSPGTIAGYIPLDLFGGTLGVPLGDESIVNVDVPTFTYNGQPASRVGIDSNGYLVVGGGTSSDNECCTLPAGASPNAPNNILAPFWTDLDGSGVAGALVNVLTDGVSTWVVVEWRVNDFGSTTARTFQTWIGVDGVQDIAFSYDPSTIGSAPVGQDLVVGAENAAGAGDVRPGLPAGDLRVTSTDPAPGDSLTYDVTVRGIWAGPGNVHSEMTAPGVPGVTTIDTPVEVLPRN